MSINKRDVIEICQSMFQPLRQAKQAQNGLSTTDLEVEFDRRAIVTPKARFPKKGKQYMDGWLKEKHKELKKAEERNLEMVAGVWMIFSQQGFQALFNPAEKLLLQKACQFMQFYITTHNVLMQKRDERIVGPVDEIGAIYTKEYFELQKRLILFFPELFSLVQRFKMPRMSKKIEQYFKDESQSMGKRESTNGVILDHRGFILGGREGDIVIMLVQQINRRALLLREAIEHMQEGSKEEEKLKDIYEHAEDMNLFTNEMMRKTDKLSIHVNRDPFCLRELLAEDDVYVVIAEMAKGKSREMRRALRFLRDLSVLVKSGYFINDGFEGKGIIVAFALKYMRSREIKACIKSGDQAALMEALISKAKEALKLVEPVLREFVTSDYFTKRATLLPSIRDTEEKHQSKLEKRVSNGGECIELFLIEKEESKKWKPTRPRSQTASEVPLSHKKKKGKSSLKILGMIAPFLILGAIPFVGPVFPLIGFIVLGIAGFANWIAPENKKTDKKQPRQSEVLSRNKSTAANDAVHDPREKGKEKQESRITIGKRSSMESVEIVESTDKVAEKEPICDADNPAVEELVITSHPTRISPVRSPVNVNSCLGGGRWLIEDRKRRERLAANDEFKLNNPASASEPEISRTGWFSDSNDSDGGYMSFPDIGDTSDDEETIGYIQRSPSVLGR